MPRPLFIPSSSAMRIEFEGEEWTLDVKHVTTRQAKEIYKFIGMPILRLFRRFGELVQGDGEDSQDGQGEDDFEDSEELYNILICLYWLMRCQCGVREPLDSTDMELVPFLTALMEAMLADAPAGDAPAEEAVALPPTQPGGPPSPEPSTPKATTPRRRKTEVKMLPEPAGTA